VAKIEFKSLVSIDKLISKFKAVFIEDSGGKKTLNLKKAGVLLVALFLVSISLMAFFSGGNDITFYRRTSQSQSASQSKVVTDNSPNPDRKTATDLLFKQGEKKKEQDKLQAQAKARQHSEIKYFAPQLLDGNTKGSKAIRAGAKLLGFLLNNIDTRDPSVVRVLLPKGGESMGVEIPSGSILSGQFSYGGNGDKVFIVFHRLDTSDGKIQKVNARALDSQDYSSGVRGERYSENGIKIASQMGLSMFAGMTDTLTDKEALGMGANAVQAKPTMKNALLQGMSKAAQDEAGRTASEIQSLKDYVVVTEGKEIIVQLLEDYR
jgi:hypothetical protein